MTAMTPDAEPRTIYRLTGMGLGLAAPDGVLPRAALAQMDAAGLLMDRARAEAESLGQAARDAYEAEKARGLAEGRAEARREAAARLMSEQAALDTALGALESELADLVLSTVRNLIQRYDRSELAIELTRSALATMRSENRVQLHVPPAVQDPLRAALPALMADYPEIELIDVIADPALASPNLRMESALGVVDFVLDDTLDGLKRLLRGG